MPESEDLLANLALQLPSDKAHIHEVAKAFESSKLPLHWRLRDFPRHVRRQDLSRFLVRAEIFQKILHVNGNIVECGVLTGGGLFGWMHLSSIYEPFNHLRRIVGFDTFEGFPSVDEKDSSQLERVNQAGDLHVAHGMKEEIEELAKLHDANRPIGHVPKVELVAGDATVSIPKFVEERPHFLVSLLYLDFDLYEPTKAALEAFLPRAPKGAVIAFDELNSLQYPGETTAFLESVGASSARLRRSPIDPQISYFVVGE